MATIVGLDIGSHSVKAARLEARGRSSGFTVIDYEEVPLLPGAPEELPERQEVALRELKVRGALEGDLFVTGLPGDAAATRTIFFPFADARKVEQTLPFELEAEIPFDIDDVVITWSIVGERLSETGGKETEVLVAYARREAVVEHLELLATAEIDPRHVSFQPHALEALVQGVFTSALDEFASPEVAATTPGGTLIQLGTDGVTPAVAIVDIGRRSTTVTVINEDRIVSGHTILHGGDDATRALARDLALPMEEAERGKRKEAFIEVLGARAQFPQQTQISEILKRAYAPIARRLRQIFQGDLSRARVRVVKVILTGGGSRVINLERHLAEVLNVRVARGHELNEALKGALPLEVTDAPQAATALCYALTGFYGAKSRSLLDFRTGEFAWRGELDFLREKAIAFGGWAAVLMAALLVSAGAQAWVLASEEGDLRDRQLQACQSITGQEIESVNRCLAIIQETIGTQTETGVVSWSAVDTYLEVSKRVPAPETMPRKITELDINSERVRMKATTSDFDAVDKFVKALEGGKCFSNVEKGTARNNSSGVEFNVIVRLDCETAKGEADPDWVRGVKRGAVATGMRKLKTPTKTTAAAKKPAKGDSDDAKRADKTVEVIKAAREATEATKEEAQKRAARKQRFQERRTEARTRARERALERAKEVSKMTPEERLERLQRGGLAPKNLTPPKSDKEED